MNPTSNLHNEVKARSKRSSTLYVTENGESVQLTLKGYESENHGTLYLFPQTKIRKAHYWEFIRLVAPAATPPNGRLNWNSKDAPFLYCLRCDMLMKNDFRQGHSVRRHLIAKHKDYFDHTDSFPPHLVNSSSSSSIDAIKSSRQITSQTIPSTPGCREALACESEKYGVLYLFKQNKVRKPEYWNFIRLVAPAPIRENGGVWTSRDAQYLYCIKCDLLVKNDVGQGHNIKRHMQKKHEQFLQLYQTVELQSLSNDARVEDDYRASKQKGNVVKRNGEVVDNEVAGIFAANRFGLGAQKSRKADLLLTQWLATSFHSIDLVEDKMFHEFIKVISTKEMCDTGMKSKKAKLINSNQSLPVNHYSLPTEIQVEEKIKQLYENTRSKLNEFILQECKHYCLLFHEIEDFITQSTFLGYTIEYLTSDFRYRTFTIMLQSFEPTCYNYIAGTKRAYDGIITDIESILRSWELKSDYITLLLRDSGCGSSYLQNGHFDIQSAIESEKRQSLNQIRSLSCISHIFQATFHPFLYPSTVLKINKDVKYTTFEHQSTVDIVAGVVHHVRQVLWFFQVDKNANKYISKSPGFDGKQSFFIVDNYYCNRKAIASKLKKKAASFKYDWNSTLTMLRNCLQNRSCLENLFESFSQTESNTLCKDFDVAVDGGSLSEWEWNVIEEVVTIASKFDKAMTAIRQDSHPSLSFAIPILQDLCSELKTYTPNKKLDDIAESSILLNIGKVILSVFERKAKALLDLEFIWISVLDHRVARRFSNCATYEMQAMVKKHLIDHCISLSQSLSFDPKSYSLLDSHMAESNGRYFQCMSSSFSHHDNGTNACDNNFGSPDGISKMIDIEVNLYIETVTQSSTLEAALRKEDAFDEDPLEWWRCKGVIFPTLSKLARKWLAVPAISSFTKSKCQYWLNAIEYTSQNRHDTDITINQDFVDSINRQCFINDNLSPTYWSNGCLPDIISSCIE